MPNPASLSADLSVGPPSPLSRRSGRPITTRSSRGRPRKRPRPFSSTRQAEFKRRSRSASTSRGFRPAPSAPPASGQTTTRPTFPLTKARKNSSSCPQVHSANTSSDRLVVGQRPWECREELPGRCSRNGASGQVALGSARRSRSGTPLRLDHAGVARLRRSRGWRRAGPGSSSRAGLRDSNMARPVAGLGEAEHRHPGGPHHPRVAPELGQPERAVLEDLRPAASLARLARRSGRGGTSPAAATPPPITAALEVQDVDEGAEGLRRALAPSRPPPRAPRRRPRGPRPRSWPARGPRPWPGSSRGRELLRRAPRPSRRCPRPSPGSRREPQPQGSPSGIDLDVADLPRVPAVARPEATRRRITAPPDAGAQGHEDQARGTAARSPPGLGQAGRVSVVLEEGRAVRTRRASSAAEVAGRARAASAGRFGTPAHPGGARSTIPGSPTRRRTSIVWPPREPAHRPLRTERGGPPPARARWARGCRARTLPSDSSTRAPFR